MAITRTGIIILLLVAAAVLTSWLKRSTPPTTEATAQLQQQVDYFLEDFHVDQYDDNGVLSYQIEGQRLEHFQNTKTSHISSPIISVLQKTAPWTIQAQSALLKPEDQDELVLSGDVDIQRPGVTEAEPFVLKTEALLVKPDAQTMQAEQTVTLLGQGSKIIAEHMFADLKNDQITLQDVKGRYEP